MKKLRLKSQNFNIAMKELNFDISKWNLQQKAIFRSIYKIVPNDNDFIKNISKYLKENLDKNDLKELKRKTKKEIQKIDLKYFSNTLKREIKFNLENKNIDIKDIEILKNIYNDTWNILLLFEIKNKRVNKDFLYIAHSKKQKEFEQFYLEKYKINLDFFAIEDKEKVKEIFKFNIDESVKKQLIIFTRNYVSTEIFFEDDFNNKIKIFVEENFFINTIKSTMLLLELDIDYEKILLIYSLYNDFKNEKSYLIKIKNIETILMEYEENFHKKEKENYKKRIESIIFNIQQNENLYQ